MDAGELLEAANAIARPCTRLSRGTGGPVAGYFQPASTITPPKSEWSVFVAIHPRAFELASIDADRWLAVWMSPNFCECRAEFVDEPSQFKGGVPLVARGCVDRPPFDALAVHGDERVRHWLLQHGWDPSWGVNSNFAEYKTVCAYQSLALARHPLWYEGECDVQVGGWPWMWPEEHGLPPKETELLAWTFAEAEPWLEVRRYRGVIDSHCRIT